MSANGCDRGHAGDRLQEPGHRGASLPDVRMGTRETRVGLPAVPRGADRRSLAARRTIRHRRAIPEEIQP